MQVVEMVTDEQLIGCFDELVNARLCDAKQFPDAVRHYADTDGHSAASFVLDEGSLAVRVRWDSDGCHSMSFAGVDDSKSRLPAFMLYLNGHQELIVEFGSTQSDVPRVSEMLAKVEAMQVSINELVPYGWVENDRITTVIFCGQFVIREQLGIEVSEFGLSSYVLQGERMPGQLRMGGRDVDWMTAVWQQIADGRLVRLTERINSLDGQVFARGDGTNMGCIEFGASDGQKPVFVVDTPYIYWHPRENFPGEFLLEWDTSMHQQPYDNDLTGWFR